MQVTVKGRVIESIDVEKEGRKYTDVLLHQKGENQLIRCRVPRQKITEGAEVSYYGSLLAWQAGSGVGLMVYCVNSGD